jgi:membrane protein YdbS with pleckstrin-like domain
MPADILTYQCPHCNSNVPIDDSVIGEKVDCPKCDRSFRPEIPIAKQVAADPEADQEEAVFKGADDESTLEEIHPAGFRRHFFMTLFCWILLFGGIAGIVFGGMTGFDWGLGLGAIVAGGIVTLIALFFLLKWFAVSQTTKLTLTTERILFRKGIFKRSTSEVRYVDIRNIAIDQSFHERLFRFGDLAISSSGQDDMEIVIDDIPNPTKVAELIRRQQ